jgi:selenocysteine-specific translation elongation factor
VLTKADKVGRGQRTAMRREVQQRLGLAVAPLAVSVTTGEGRHELLLQIERLATAWRDTHQRGE